MFFLIRSNSSMLFSNWLICLCRLPFSPYISFRMVSNTCCVACI